MDRNAPQLGRLRTVAGDQEVTFTVSVGIATARSAPRRSPAGSMRRAATFIAPHDLRLAVNLSGRNLEDADRVDRVARILEDTRFPAEHVELELTEGVSIAESGRASSLLEELHQRGIQLAIDEIGSADGRSSLLETMVDMADVLGLEVVAEGVEHSAQAAFLRQHGCDFAQGHLFSKPVTAEALTSVLASADAKAAASVG